MVLSHAWHQQGSHVGLLGEVVANAEESGHAASQVKLRHSDFAQSVFIKVDCLREATEDEAAAYTVEIGKYTWCRRMAFAQDLLGTVCGMILAEPDSDGEVRMRLSDNMEQFCKVSELVQTTEAEYAKKQAFDKGVLMNKLVGKHWGDIQFEAKVDGMGKQAASIFGEAIQ